MYLTYIFIYLKIKSDKLFHKVQLLYKIKQIITFKLYKKKLMISRKYKKKTEIKKKI